MTFSIQRVTVKATATVRVRAREREKVSEPEGEREREGESERVSQIPVRMGMSIITTHHPLKTKTGKQNYRPILITTKDVV